MRLHDPRKYVLERRKAGDKSICDTWPLHGWLDPTSTGIRSLEGAAIPEIAIAEIPRHGPKVYLVARREKQGLRNFLADRMSLRMSHRSLDDAVRRACYH